MHDKQNKHLSQYGHRQEQMRATQVSDPYSIFESLFLKMYSKYVQSYAIFWHLPIYFPHAESDFFLNMGVTYFLQPQLWQAKS